MTAKSSAQESDSRIGRWNEINTSATYDSLLRVVEDLGNGMMRMNPNAKLKEVNQWHVDFKCDGEIRESHREFVRRE